MSLFLNRPQFLLFCDIQCIIVPTFNRLATLARLLYKMTKRNYFIVIFCEAAGSSSDVVEHILSKIAPCLCGGIFPAGILFPCDKVPETICDYTDPDAGLEAEKQSFHLSRQRAPDYCLQNWREPWFVLSSRNFLNHCAACIVRADKFRAFQQKQRREDDQQRQRNESSYSFSIFFHVFISPLKTRFL